MTDVALAEQPNIKDLVTAKNMDKDALMAMLGQKDISAPKDESTKAYLPRLSIEHNTEDDDGKTLPRGKWRVQNANGETVHSDTVIFRPFLRRYMYSVWDSREENYSSITIQASSFGDKFFDTKGGLKCGKLSAKELEVLGPDDPARTLSANVKCSQIIYGTVALSGNAEAIPHAWYAKGSNFMPVSDWIKTLEKQGKLLFNTRALLTTSKQKHGSNIYYKANIADKDSVEFDPKGDIPILESFMDVVNLHNSDIEQKYRESRKDFEDVEIVNSLDE
tara:strand:+ start:1551 stop:2381 length:831 start_codon:yes stop_codon:yes gene_type:complete